MSDRQPVRTGPLVLLRHGQSTANIEGRFTGWVDVPLTEQGEAEAVESARLLARDGLVPDVVHTSVMARSIRSADLLLEELDRLWIPVQRTWRLNERQYGALTGRRKQEVRAEVAPIATTGGAARCTAALPRCRRTGWPSCAPTPATPLCAPTRCPRWRAWPT